MGRYIIASDGGCKHPNTDKCFSLGAAVASELHTNDIVDTMVIYEETGSTHQRAELSGAIAAFKLANEITAKDCEADITLITDSAYVLQAVVNSWWVSWKSKGWITAMGSPVINKDLWEELAEEVEKLEAYWAIWHIKGHVATIGEKMSASLIEHHSLTALRDTIKERYTEQREGRAAGRAKKAFDDFERLNGVQIGATGFNKFVVNNVLVDTLVRYEISESKHIWGDEGNATHMARETRRANCVL